MRLLRLGLPLSLFVATLGATPGCSGTGPSPLGDDYGSSTDGAVPDSGLDETGTIEAGPKDGGSPDVGPADASVPDTGSADAESPDTGLADAAAHDASDEDAGLLDASPPGDAEPDAGPLACEPPLADCTDSGTCSTDKSSDVENCGACGHACPAATGASASCVNGSCATACSPGYLDCNGQPQDGCECAPAPNGAAECAGTSCAFVCNPGFSNCVGTANNLCETPTGFDNANCGGCGIVCPGATTCAGGTCVTPPTSVAPAEANGVGAIATDGTTVYWIANPSAAFGCDGALRSASVAGGTVKTISADLCGPSGLTLDFTSVYVTAQLSSSITTGAILSFPKSAGADAGAGTTVVAYPNIAPFNPVLEGGTFYVAGDDSGSTPTGLGYGVWSAAAGGTPSAITTTAGSYLWAFALTPTSVAFLEGIPGFSMSVYETPLAGDGGAPTLLATTAGAQDMTYFQGNLYLADVGQITVVGPGGQTSAALLPSAVNGSHVISDSRNVYVSTQVSGAQPGMVAVMLGGQSALTPVASTTGLPPQSGVTIISDVPLASDGQYVYFVDATGIHRAPT